MATWRELITQAMTGEWRDTPPVAPDSWDNLIKCTLTEDELDVEFDEGYGVPEGKPFTLWTKTRVYFPCKYDGREWVGWTWREPCEWATEHQGGG